jgi:hypothetical protein
VALSETPTPPRPSDAGQRPREKRRLGRALLTWLPLVFSALWTAVIFRLLAKDWRYAIPLAASAVLWVIPAVLEHRRQRALLLRGNVPDVLEAWTPMIERTPYPETVQPILMATAYAANGWTDAAREAMARARRGPAWDAAAEQRLVVETLLDAFDGDRELAVCRATVLAGLPPPNAGIFLRRRIRNLRLGLGALARAFARRSSPRDRVLLRAAAKSSPLFFWAFRYAGAIFAIDHGRASLARKLIGGAPRWSPSSVFADFHREIEREIERLSPEVDEDV